MVGSQGRIVESPVVEVVVGGVEVPLGGGKVDGDLLPVTLSLEVAKHRRSVLAGVRVAGDESSQSQPESKHQKSQNRHFAGSKTHFITSFIILFSSQDSTLQVMKDETEISNNQSMF